MEILRENKELYKGIFWIVDQNDLENIYDELESIHENIFCNQYEEKNNVYIVPSCDDKPIKFKIGE